MLNIFNMNKAISLLLFNSKRVYFSIFMLVCMYSNIFVCLVSHMEYIIQNKAFLNYFVEILDL